MITCELGIPMQGKHPLFSTCFDKGSNHHSLTDSYSTLNTNIKFGRASYFLKVLLDASSINSFLNPFQVWTSGHFITIRFHYKQMTCTCLI